MSEPTENQLRDTQRLAIKLAGRLDDLIRGRFEAIPTAIDLLRNCGIDGVRTDYLKYMRGRADAAATTWQKRIDTLVEFSNKAKTLGAEPPIEIIRMIGEAVENRDKLQCLDDEQLIEGMTFVVAE